MFNLIVFGLSAIALGAAYFVGRQDGEAAGRAMVTKLLKAFTTEQRIQRGDLNLYRTEVGVDRG